MAVEDHSRIKLARWCRRGLDHLPILAALPTIEVLRDLFADRLWLQVAPGPSLERTAGELAEFKGRAVIVALTHAVRPLLRAGVTPDLVIGCEEADQRPYLEGLDLDAIGALVLSAFSHPAMLALPCRRIIYTSNHAVHWIGDALGAHTELANGPTVASPAATLSQFTGCAPLVLTGHDLALGPAEQFYAAGAPGDGFDDHLVRVRGKDNETLTAPQTFATQAQWLGEFSKHHPVIDATAGGALIANTHHRDARTGKLLTPAGVAADFLGPGEPFDVREEVIRAVAERFDPRAQLRHARRWALDTIAQLRRGARRAEVARRRVRWARSFTAGLPLLRLALDAMDRDLAGAGLLAGMIDQPHAAALQRAALAAPSLDDDLEISDQIAQLVLAAEGTLRPLLHQSVANMNNLIGLAERTAPPATPPEDPCTPPAST